MRFLYKKFSGISIHMLGQEIPLESVEVEVDSFITPKAVTVFENELDINPDEALYLFTWSPNPEEIPDSDFNTQHAFCFPFISDLLSTMECGLACVEETQKGNPHYHGWYQQSRDPKLNVLKKVYVKVMQRFGNYKVTKSLGHYKINSYVKQANCLYYYKKDMLEASLYVPNNPIKKGMYPHIDWNSNYSLFTKKGRESVADIEDRINLRSFYKQFYENSL